MKGEAMTFIYCVACQNGEEETVASTLRQYVSNGIVIIPLMERTEKKNGEWIKKHVKLIPGYLFIYSAQTPSVHDILGVEKVNRVLHYVEHIETKQGVVHKKTYELEGDDKAFAYWIYTNEGIIRISQAIDNQEHGICFISGPLQKLSDSIQKVDKHNRKALIQLFFKGTAFTAWLSFEWIMQIDK